MLKLRLKKYGRKRQPSYRIVAIDSRVKRDGKAIEELGFHNPITNETQLNFLRIKSHINNGAQVSQTVQNLLIKTQVLKKRN